LFTSKKKRKEKKEMITVLVNLLNFQVEKEWFLKGQKLLLKLPFLPRNQEIPFILFLFYFDYSKDVENFWIVLQNC